MRTAGYGGYASIRASSTVLKRVALSYESASFDSGEPLTFGLCSSASLNEPRNKLSSRYFLFISLTPFYFPISTLAKVYGIMPRVLQPLLCIDSGNTPNLLLHLSVLRLHDLPAALGLLHMAASAGNHFLARLQWYASASQDHRCHAPQSHLHQFHFHFHFHFLLTYCAWSVTQIHKNIWQFIYTHIVWEFKYIAKVISWEAMKFICNNKTLQPAVLSVLQWRSISYFSVSM